MRQEDIKERCRKIKYELKEGSHTFTMCQCGRHGCRTEKCWECYLDELFYNRLSSPNPTTKKSLLAKEDKR